MMEYLFSWSDCLAHQGKHGLAVSLPETKPLLQPDQDQPWRLESLPLARQEIEAEGADTPELSLVQTSKNRRESYPDSSEPSP